MASQDNRQRLVTDRGAAAAERTGLPIAAAARYAGNAVIGSFRAQAALVLVSVLYVGIGLGLSVFMGRMPRFALYGDVQLAVFLNLAVAGIVIRMAITLWRDRPARPLQPVWTDLVVDFRLGRRLIEAVPALVLLPLVLSVYTSLKALIPEIAPFVWDAPLAAADQAVHGGVAPWTLLQPVFGRPAVTRWIDWAYGPVWFWMLLALQFWQVFSLHPQRAQVLVTFVLCWALLGTAAAILFASAGPVYYGAVVAGPDPFAPLLAYLNETAARTPLFAVQASADLWQAYLAGAARPGAGISAMPSLHVSMGMLLVLATWRLGTVVRLLSGAYLALLLVGSVLLAWHYAIDGYVAILGTWALWWAAGRALGRWHRQNAKSTLAIKDS